MRVLNPSLVLASLLLASIQASADPVIYATGQIGTKLLAIDAKTGETKVVGDIGQPGSAPLAFGSDGKLYTITDSMKDEGARSQLAVIDPTTGKATPIGEPWPKSVRTMALGPGPDGALYAGALVGNMLYRTYRRDSRPRLAPSRAVAT